MITLSETLAAALAADKPQRVLLEFLDENGDVLEDGTFSNEEIVMSRGVHITAPFNGDKELTVGLCPSSQITFALLNDVRQLSDFTFGECKAWLGARIDSGTPTMKTKTFTENGQTVTYEFAPLGIFKVDRPDIVQKDIIDITANDRMTRFDKEMPSDGELGISQSAYPITLLTMLQAMCSNVGVTLKNNSFLNSDLQISGRPQAFASKTMREVLKWIAEAAGSIARFTRSGELEMAWFAATPVATYDEHHYKDFTPCWYEVAQIDGLKVRNTGETQESKYGTDPENPYIIAGNPFLR